MMKEKKGITLISLVITIIILLILAGITISQLTENGLLEKAKLARKEQEIAQYEEKIKLAQLELATDEYENESEKLEKIQEILKGDKLFKDSKFKIVENQDKKEIIVVTKEEYVFSITTNSVKYLKDTEKDIEAPEVTISANTTEWINGNVILTGESQDKESGIVAYAWSNQITEPSETTTSEELGKWNNIEKTTETIIKTKTVTENGTIYFWTKDAEGNTNRAEIEITNIDKTPPPAPLIEVKTAHVSATECVCTVGLARPVEDNVAYYEYSYDINKRAWTKINSADSLFFNIRYSRS